LSLGTWLCRRCILLLTIREPRKDCFHELMAVAEYAHLIPSESPG
jgi:hypothetical protein